MPVGSFPSVHAIEFMKQNGKINQSGEISSALTGK
jgi:hypothetical protein